MKKNNFWNDAAKYGAIMAFVAVVFKVLSMYVTNIAISALSLTLYLSMLYIFTKRRAKSYGGGNSGYSYGQCLVFIICMSIFSGIIEGAYQIVASNWLFTAQYTEMLARMTVMFEGMGFYTSDQIDMMQSLSEKMMRSPFFIIIINVFASFLSALFFGLIISAFTKRDPDIFASNNE